MTNEVNSTNQILRIRDVSAKCGLPRSTIYEYVKNGIFPKPIGLGERSVGWLSSEIDAWINARIKISRGGKNV